jgi:DNA-binding LacI/PurR family transcriptional regulator
LVYRIGDVAKRAGVSKSTVSRVLNRSALVDPETRRRVLEAAQKLDYYRSASALQLARGGQSDFFGLLISDVENPVFPEMIKGFEMAAAARGYNLFLCTSDYRIERAQAAVRKMIENGVRGVAIMTSSLNEEVTIPLASRNIAVVMVDLDKPGRNVSSVAIDYQSGVTEAAQHLAKLGHKKVTFIAGSADRRSARRYREAVVLALDRNKLQLQQIVECNQTLEGGHDAVWKLSTSAPPPTALVCVNDLVAIGAVSALREFGLSVPGDVSVVGCEDIYPARFVTPALTTIRFDRKSLGRIAFETLERLTGTRGRQGIKVPIATHLMVRASTAAWNPQPTAWQRD